MSALATVTQIRPGAQPSSRSTSWLSPAEVCEVWPGMTVRKLQRMRAEGRGPAYSKAGKTITYATSDVDAFIRAHRITTREQS